VFLAAEALRAGERYGITTHNEVTGAFPGNDGHWDPGPEYPIDAFMALLGASPQPAQEITMERLIRVQHTNPVQIWYIHPLLPEPQLVSEQQQYQIADTGVPVFDAAYDSVEHAINRHKLAVGSFIAALKAS
jgi:hypothetical protein